MNKEVETMLDKSPRPLLYTIAILALMIVVIVTGNVFAGIVLGLVAGSYFGNYRGRFAVMDAWRKQVSAEHEARMNELDKEYEELLQRG